MRSLPMPPPPCCEEAQATLRGQVPGLLRPAIPAQAPDTSVENLEVIEPPCCSILPSRGPNTAEQSERCLLQAVLLKLQTHEQNDGLGTRRWITSIQGGKSWNAETSGNFSTE